MMPPRGAGVRAEQLATLGRIAHEKFTSAEIGRLLEELAPLRGGADVRLVRGEPDPRRRAATGRRSGRVPSELRAEMSRAASLALPVWVEGAAGERLRVVPARTCARTSSCAAATSSASRRLRRAVRRAARRLRAGMKTAEVRERLRAAEGAPGAARRRGRRRDGEPSGARRGRSRSTQKAFELEVSSGSATTTVRGGSTRRSTRSRAAATATSG